MKIPTQYATIGWAVVRVAGDESEPKLAYSVGLFKSFRHPEVIVFGLEIETLHKIINTIAGMVAAGHEFVPDTVSSDVLEGTNAISHP